MGILEEQMAIAATKKEWAAVLASVTTMLLANTKNPTFGEDKEQALLSIAEKVQDTLGVQDYFAKYRDEYKKTGTIKDLEETK